MKNHLPCQTAASGGALIPPIPGSPNGWFHQPRPWNFTVMPLRRVFFCTSEGLSTTSWLLRWLGVKKPETNNWWGKKPTENSPTWKELCSSSNRCWIFNGRLAVSFSEGDGWMLTWTRQGWIWSHMIFLPLPGLMLLECIFFESLREIWNLKRAMISNNDLESVHESICSFHLRYLRECNTSVPFAFHHLQDHQSPIKRPPTSKSEASRKNLPGDASNHVFIRPSAVWGVRTLNLPWHQETLKQK